MLKPNLNLLLQPSGLNNRFYGSDLPFNEYIELMQNIIMKGRCDLTPENQGEIVLANSPFSWANAHTTPAEKGILLIHGLFDSPFYLRNLGEHFLRRGFLVRSILLPGHGTVPGDLLTLNHKEWSKAVHYGVKSLAKEVSDIYLAGYSLGGMLALEEILSNQNQNIKGLILFAPAFQPRSKLKNLLAKHHRLFSWMNFRTKWYQIKTPCTFTKYSCYAFNAGFEACKVIRSVNKKLQSNRINLPLFIVMSADDETISDEAIISFFTAQPNPKNKLVLYTTHQHKPYHDKRIVIRPSQFPRLKILNFSHSCMTISPDNLYLGNHGTFFDLQHYTDHNKINKEQLYAGAITKQNLRKYQISRLSYNPDFSNLLRNIDEFFVSLE